MPLSENERQFIQVLRNDGVIRPELVSSDKDIQVNIKKHPALLWVIERSAKTQ